MLTACSTVSVNQQTPAKAIAQSRQNILSDNKLSTTTASALLSVGLQPEECLAHIEHCIHTLQTNRLDTNKRLSLAHFAELYYAKVQQLANTQACQVNLQRPAIDPYYANAPLTPEQQAKQDKQTKQCLIDYRQALFNTVRFSFAYLFYPQLTQAKSDGNTNVQTLPNEIDIQTQDIYNAASNDIISQLYQSQGNLLSGIRTHYIEIPNNTKTLPKTTQIKVMTLEAQNPQSQSLDIYLPNEDNYLTNAYQQTSAISDLVSTYGLKLTGLNSISKRSGFGIGYVGLLNDRYTTNIRELLSKNQPKNKIKPDDDPADRIYSTGHLLLTGYIQPKGKTLEEVLDSHHLDVHLYNPYRTQEVSILGQTYPLAANFSASYGLWLSENQLDGVGYLSLLSRHNDDPLPRLFMLEPYDPNKRVIIMIHGLASSPATWVNLTNDIFNDPTLRQNYQVWQIFYATNLPMLENRYQIQRLIETAYQKTDPTGKHPASHHSVIISHSMGAVMSRMMLSHDDLTKNLDKLTDSSTTNANLPTQPSSNQPNDEAIKAQLDSNRQLNKLIKQTYQDQQLSDRFHLHPLVQVDTAVFISAPFRGTDYADRWFTRAIRKIIHLPLGLVQTVTNNLSSIATEGELANNPLGALYLQNGASQLSNRSSFIQLTKDISISPKVTYHSIMANNTDTPIKPSLDDQPDTSLPTSSRKKPNQRHLISNDKNLNTLAFSEDISDGIVPYTSSHLDGATSETILEGGHSIQANPKTILLLRKILHQQLQE